MENFTFSRSFSKQKQVNGLAIGGMLVLENSQLLKQEFMSVANSLSRRIKITLTDVEMIDLAFIQLLIAFINHMDENHVTYTFEWNLDDDQKTLLESVGLSNELFMTN